MRENSKACRRPPRYRSLRCASSRRAHSEAPSRQRIPRLPQMGHKKAVPAKPQPGDRSLMTPTQKVTAEPRSRGLHSACCVPARRRASPLPRDPCPAFIAPRLRHATSLRAATARDLAAARKRQTPRRSRPRRQSARRRLPPVGQHLRRRSRRALTGDEPPCGRCCTSVRAVREQAALRESSQPVVDEDTRGEAQRVLREVAQCAASR